MARLKFLLRCIVSIALIGLVTRKVNWAGLEFALQRVDVRWLVVGSLGTLLLMGVLAFRWRIFLRQQGIELGFGTIFSLTWAGQFFNSVLPGSTGGDVVKIYQLCRLHPAQKAAAAASVLTDRLSAVVALLAMAGTAFVLAPPPLQSILAWSGSIQMVALLCFAGGFAVVLLGWFVFRFLQRTHWLGRLRRTLAASKKSFQLNGPLPLAIGLSFAIHFGNFLILYSFARSLGIGISYGQVLLFMPMVLFLVMIPVTVNGHGLREVLLIFYFTHFHIALAGGAGIGVKETVLALSVLCVSNDLMWSLPGGLWYLLRFKR